MSRVDNTGGSGFTVDNGTGLAVRTKLNQIIAALSTLNQGSGDPTIGVAAYVPHIDGDTLKIRNSANNAFVSLGDVSATNFGHAGLSAANTFTSTNIFQEDVTFDGATAGRDVVFDRSDNALEFADNAKAIFGTGADLEIFHDASNSIINDAGTGVLKFQLGGSTKFQLESGGVALTGGAAANITALSDGSTIIVDFATACHHSVTLGGNRTLSGTNSGTHVGQSGSIFITQDGTGSRTLAFDAAYKFPGGTAPTLSTAANAIDRLDYIIKASGVIHAVLTLDVK